MYIIQKDSYPEETLDNANAISRGVGKPLHRPWSLKKALHFFIAGHSTMEWIHFTITDYLMRGDVASHLVRHTKGHPRFVVQSMRPDWNKGEARPASSTHRFFSMQATPLALMYMARQRLCTRAMKETREWMLELKRRMWEYGETYGDGTSNVAQAMSLIMVPDCIAQCGCPYGKKTCGHFDKFIDNYGDNFDQIDIRYKNYQTFLLGE